MVSHFRVFGSVCYVFVPDHLSSKFEKKAIHCIFMGYDDQIKVEDVANQQSVGVTYLEMLSLMKHLHGGHHKQCRC